MIDNKTIENYTHYFFGKNCIWSLCAMGRTNIVWEVNLNGQESIVRAYPNTLQKEKFNREVSSLKKLNSLGVLVPEIVEVDTSCLYFPTPLYIYKKIQGNILLQTYEEVINSEKLFNDINNFLVECSKIKDLFGNGDFVAYLGDSNGYDTIKNLLIGYNLYPKNTNLVGLIDIMDKNHELVYIDLNPRNIIIKNGTISGFIDFDYRFKGNIFMAYGNLLSTNFVRNNKFLMLFLERISRKFTNEEICMIHIFAIWRCKVKIESLSKDNQNESIDYEERITFNLSQINDIIFE